MSKIGLIYVSYNMEDYTKKSLPVWMQAKQQNLGGNEFVISVVSVPFEEYKDFNVELDQTIPYLQEKLQSGEIDNLITEPKFIKEHLCRDVALKYLLSRGCDIICMADADEFFNLEEIEKIFDYVKLEKFTTWFSIPYKNYVFSERNYLKEPFCPPRIFRVKSNGYELDSFYFDNDLVYKGTIVEFNKFVNKEISYKMLPSKVIPSKLVWIRHLSWISNEKSKLKCFYQQNHFGGQCGYKWNELDNKLEFNGEFYKVNGLPIPEVIEE